jgi:hypothetical protein
MSPAKPTSRSRGATPRTPTKKRRASRKSAPPPAALVLPPCRRRTYPEDLGPPGPIDNERIEIIALNLARSDTWRERKQHLQPLTKFLLTFQQLSLIVHRLPSNEERVKAMEMLKDSIQDSEHSFFLFSQSFALPDERRTVSSIFQIPLEAE